MLPTHHAKLLNALTEYDRRASRRKGHNRYALGHYCAALRSTAERMEAGATLRAALCRSYSGRLLHAMLRAVGEPESTREEQR